MRNSAPRPRRAGRRAALASVLAWPMLVRGRDATPPSLGDRLQRTLAGCGLPAGSLGLFVSRVDGGRTIAALQGDSPFVMASTAKIVTSLAALDLLGPRWRWRTHAFATGPVSGGRLMGDLLIVGGGDPRLSSTELRHWLTRLRQQGVAEVRGDLVVDRSAFLLHEQDHAGTPPPGPDRPHHARPDGLLIDASVVQVQVGATRGRPPEVRTEPPLAGPLLANRLQTGPACTAAARWQDHEGQPQLSVEGHWGPSCGTRQFSLSLPAGASLATQAVGGLWRDVGGRVLGRVREGDVAAGRPDHARLPLLGADGEPLFPLSTHLSPPLPDVVHEINKTSNNLAARHLMLSLARGFPAQSATLASARQRLQQWLRRQGLADGDIELDNGSGLSRAERARPQALVHLLRRAWSAEVSHLFLDSLPIAGVDGTLAHRLQGGAAMGQAFLKTGSLLDARALAGYVRSRSGQVHAVAVFVNHPDAARARPAIDAVIETLAREG